MKNVFDIVRKGLKAIVNVIPDVDVIVNTTPSKFQYNYSNSVNAGSINKVFINGQEVSGIDDCKQITIIVNGNAKNISVCSGNVEVKGNVTGDVDSTSGDINVCGDVDGSIETTSGDVTVGKSVGGSIDTTSGDVTVGE